VLEFEETLRSISQRGLDTNCGSGTGRTQADFFEADVSCGADPQSKELRRILLGLGETRIVKSEPRRLNPFTLLLPLPFSLPFYGLPLPSHPKPETRSTRNTYR